jgi:hypothetical protein
MRLRPRQRVVALAGVQLGDAALNAFATEWMKDDLGRLRVPWRLRPLFPVVKTASAAGLVAGLKWPRLGRLTANLLVVYFVLALGAHARVRDQAARYGPAVAMLGWSLAARRAFTADGTAQSSSGRVRGAAGRSVGTGRPRAA